MERYDCDSAVFAGNESWKVIVAETFVLHDPLPDWLENVVLRVVADAPGYQLGDHDPWQLNAPFGGFTCCTGRLTLADPPKAR